MEQDGTLGKAIRNARKDMSYTLEELGEKIGVTHAFLSRIENNKVKPSDKLLNKIANELDPFDSKDLRNEFNILSGKYDNIDTANVFFNEIKSSGRLEIKKYGNNRSNTTLVEKPFYKLNYLFENDYKVFYDIKTSILGEKIATIEVPDEILDKIYQKINLTILEYIKEYPFLLKSIENPDVLNDFSISEQKKRDELINHVKYMNLNDSMEKLMNILVSQDRLI